MTGKPLHDSTVLLGFYQGIGDFLSAVPVVNQLLEQGNRVVIAASEPILQLAELLDFRAGEPEFISFSTFSARGVARQMKLVSQLRRLRPDVVFVSPHAVKDVSSWKIPVLLYVLRKTAWRSTAVVGSVDEKYSGLFDQRVKVDRTLRLVEREFALHTLFGSISSGVEPDRNVFKARTEPSNSSRPRALVLHPGASREVKMWPVEYFRDIVKMFVGVMPVRFVGIRSELEPIRETLRDWPEIDFVCGPIAEAIETLADAALVVTMDSGFSHVAAFLGVRHLILYGSTDPELYAPLSHNSQVLFENKLPCQPCNAHVCKLGEPRCMRLITPDLVGKRIKMMLKETEVASVGDNS